MPSISARTQVGGHPNQVSLHLADGSRSRNITWSISSSDVEQAVDDATQWSGLRQFATARAAEMISSGAAFDDSVDLMIRVAGDDLAEVVALGSARDCRYKTEHDGDSYCAAASPKDETRVGNAGLRLLAPTTDRLCRTCAMPPPGLLCQNMQHPRVSGLRASGGTLNRSLYEAECDLGNRGIDQPGKCVPYGNDCWEQRVAIAPRRRTETIHPLALAEAVDFLDAVYRLRFKQHLVTYVPAATLSALAQPVDDRDDFKARASDLAAVIEAFVVDGPPPDVKGSLARLERLLADEGIEFDASAFLALRHAVNIRNAMQHPGKGKDLARHLTALGAQAPVASWPGAWASVQGSVIEALRNIRDVLRASSG
jgi:hypothetical protein